MKSIDGRLNNLERKFGIAGKEQKYLCILTDRDIGEADQDTYMKILVTAVSFPGLASEWSISR